MHIDHPWLHEQYSKLGFHSVRRSDRFWAGLWPDLVIEQCMMRTIKSRGGLTHGRGLSESTRDLWVRTMHKCAAVHETMSQLTGEEHITSEQHVELRISGRSRDTDDVKRVLDML